MAEQSSSRAASQKDEGGKIETDVKSADLPISTPDAMQVLAERDLPDVTPVEKAHKEILTADEPQASDKAKADLVDASRDSWATPSGYAAKKVAGISNDTERGEKYAELKSQVRHGSLPDDAGDTGGVDPFAG
jgi:hypothetical protein